MLKYQVYVAVQHLDIKAVLKKKKKNTVFHFNEYSLKRGRRNFV